MTKGAAYVRVSTDDQTEFSPDAQLKAIRAYAKQNNIELDENHIYVDEGISGKRADKRPAFMRMIGAAKSMPTPFDVILVHKFDRFARSREDSVVYKSLLRKDCGVKVISITESIEDDKFSVILEAMLEAMAEYYSLNLADEVVKGMTEKAERGGLQACPAYGYKVERNMLEVDELEADFVKLIFFKYASREMTLRQLSLLLNDLGAKTKRGNKFESRTIQYILKNPVYIGKLRWTPQKIPNAYRFGDNPEAIVRDGGHTPIVDAEIWYKAQDVLAENKILFGNRQKKSAQIRTWLKGLVFCGNCGKVLTQCQADYLQCNGYNKGKCAISCCIKISDIEGLILKEIKDIFVEKIEFDVLPQKNETAAAEHKLLKESLARLDAREQRIKQAFQVGVDTIDEYKESKQGLDDERTRLLEHLEKLDANLKESLDAPMHFEFANLHALLTDNAVDIETKYKAAHFVISKITYFKQEFELKIEYC